MSKKIFINNLNTYVAQAIFNELRNDIGEDGEKNEDSNLIFGTYIDRDSSDKPDGINKMLKVILFFGFSNLKRFHSVEIQATSDDEVLE